MTGRSTLRFAYLCVFLLLGSCSSDDDGGTPPTPEEPASLAVASGDGQTAEVGAQLPQPVTVRVTSNLGNPMSGITVSWSITSGGGTVAAGGATGADGTASATWTLGGTVGQQGLQASVSGLQAVNFTATATAGAPATITLATDALVLEGLGQTGELGPVTVEDAQGNPLDPAVASFASADEAVATVDDDGTVTSVGVGQTTVTASAGAATAEASVEVRLASFTPANDTTISGTLGFADMNIAAGITVTIDGPSNLSSAGDVTVAGTLVAECHALTVNAGGALNVTGTVQNGCAAGAPGDLSLTAAGAIDMTGATVTSDRNLTVSNATGAAASALARAGFTHLAYLPPMGAQTSHNCRLSHVTIEPTTAVTQTVSALPGQDGGDLTVTCGGHLSIQSALFVTQNGVEGVGQEQDGDGPHPDGVGGAGGNGGGVFISANAINFKSGGDFTTLVVPGHGGHGGSWYASGPTPTASGGPGGNGGLMSFTTVVTGTVGALDLDQSDAGLGGVAIAAADPGGDATATGGPGGDLGPGVPTDPFEEGTWVLDGVHWVRVGVAGVGGGAKTVPGDGAAGTAESTAGGSGGTATVTAGDGGDIWVLDTKAGSPVYTGFPAPPGPILVVGGNGGLGFGGCAVTREADVSGAGGSGGILNLTEGTPGTAGADTGPYFFPVILKDYGNGGSSGRANSPASGGPPTQVDLEALNGPVEMEGTSLTPGPVGPNCDISMVITSTTTSDPAGHGPFTRYETIVDNLFRVIPNANLEGAADIFVGSENALWVDVSGTMSLVPETQGQVQAAGTGTVAGFPGTEVMYTATISLNEDEEPQSVTYIIEVGSNGALPQGLPQILEGTGAAQSGGQAPAAVTRGGTDSPGWDRAWRPRARERPAPRRGPDLPGAAAFLLVAAPRLRFRRPEGRRRS